MPEVDHIFIWVSVGAEAEAGQLTAFGLTEGNPNVHSGQGTACRRFFFANCYLELLWICNPEEAQSERLQPFQAKKISPELAGVTGLRLVHLKQATEYLVRLGFDGESRVQQADFRPVLPLVFRW